MIVTCVHNSRGAVVFLYIQYFYSEFSFFYTNRPESRVRLPSSGTRTSRGSGWTWGTCTAGAVGRNSTLAGGGRYSAARGRRARAAC
jgi:hypothetical protein